MATTVEILAKVTADTSQFQREMQGATTAVGNAGSRMQSIAGGMSRAGGALTAGVTLPLVAIGAAAVKVSMDFESSMAKIVGLVGIAADEVDAMGDSVLKMATETGKAPLELADALFVITSAGLRGSEAMDALDRSARAGAAGLGETNDIARALAGAMNAYGADVLDAASATDVIVATARAGNFETSQFAAAIGRVLPFAKQAGATFADMGGAVALLTRTNGDAAQSVTQMAALFRAFVVPSEQAKVALGELGMSAEDLRASIADQGLPATLQMLDEALGGNRETLGRLLGSSEAASAAFQILDADAATLEATFGEVNNAAGITDEAFGAVADTGAFKLQKAMATFKATLIDIGNIIGPFVAKAADLFAGLVGKVGGLSPEMKTAVVAIAAVAAAIGPVLLIVGKLISAVIAAKGVFMAIGAVLGVIGIKVVAVIAIIAALVAGFIALWNSSEEFRTAVTNAFEQIKNVVMSVVDLIKSKLEENADAVNTIKAVWEGIVSFMSSYVIPFWSQYVSNIFQAVGVAIGFLIDVIGNLIVWFKNLGAGMLSFAATVVRGFATVVDNVLAGVQLLISSLADWLGWVPGVGDALNSARDSVTSFRDNTVTNMNNVAAALDRSSTAFANFGSDVEGGASTAAEGMRTSAAAIENGADTISSSADEAAAAMINLSEAIAAFNGQVSAAQAVDQLTVKIREVGAAAKEFEGNLNGSGAAAIDFRSTIFDAINQVNSTISTMGLEGAAAEQMFTQSMQQIVNQMRKNGIKPGDIRQFLRGLDMAPELIAQIMGRTAGAAKVGGEDTASAALDGMSGAQRNANEVGAETASQYATGVGSGVDAATNAGTELSAAALAAASVAAAGGTTAGSTLASNVGTGISSSSSVVEGASQRLSAAAVEAAAATAARNAPNVGDDLTLNAARGIQSTQSVVNNAAVGAATSAISAARGASGGAFSVGLGISLGMANGIRAGQSAVIAAAIAVARAAIAAAKRELGSNSPSKRFMEVGSDSTLGFVMGLERDMLGMQRRVGQAFDRMVQGVNVPATAARVPAAAPAMMTRPVPEGVGGRRGGIVIENFNVTSAEGERAETSVPRALRRLAWVAGLDG